MHADKCSQITNVLWKSLIVMYILYNFLTAIINHNIIGRRFSIILKNKIMQNIIFNIKLDIFLKSVNILT